MRRPGDFLTNLKAYAEIVWVQEFEDIVSLRQKKTENLRRAGEFRAVMIKIIKD